MNSVVDNRPLYLQIYEDLEHKISTGEIRYMEQIPILPELCKQYGVSDAPVRRALDELARAGLVVRRRGRGQGTFATKKLAQTTLRVLLIASFDIYKGAIETCHEVSDLLAGIQDAAAELNCNVQQVSVGGFHQQTIPDADTGYLIIAMCEEEYALGARMATGQGAPYVLINPPSACVPCVRVDMEQGAFLGVNYLAQLGHQRIAYVGWTKSQWFAPRYEGYLRALRENEIDLDPNLTQQTDGIDANQDVAALNALMSLPEPPTAIFACSDYRALRILAHCKQLGISVPQDISICGYDNISEVASVKPALTSVYHPRREQGHASVELLNRLVHEHKIESIDKLIRPELIIRDSCAPARKTHRF